MKHYLDYNATAPMRPEVAAVVQELSALPLNASSVHAWGRKARGIVEDARATLAEMLSAFPNEIIFLSSATEANNWVLRSLKGLELFVSAIEHPSVLATSRAIGSPVILPVGTDGRLDIDASAALLPDQEPFLVSLMLANNETGVIQSVHEMAAIVRGKGGLLHCDAVQAFGRMPVDFTSLGCDFLTVSAHKMGGPLGAAALVAKSNLTFAPLLTGGGQELRRRAGTENVAAIAGFAQAAALMDYSFMQDLNEMHGRFEAVALKEGGYVYGCDAMRLPNTSLVLMPGVSSETQLIRFDLDGIAVSAGSACTSGRIEPSHVLAAMGVGKEDAECALRVSSGWGTVQSDFDALLASWTKLSCAQRKA